jgi:hypothetical protein
VAPAGASSEFAARTDALQKRVNEAARALHAQGLRPTVARIRAALGGGSPNDLAPALKNWKEAVLPALDAVSPGAAGARSTARIPASIADVVQELWQRAMVAASVELKGGLKARQVIARTEEAQLLREQLRALRDQLQREAVAYGELRAQSARHEAIAKSAVTRAYDAEVRERDVLHKLGAAQQRIAELEAAGGRFRSGLRAARMASPKARRRASPLQSKRPSKIIPRASKARTKRARQKPRPRKRANSDRLPMASR